MKTKLNYFEDTDEPFSEDFKNHSNSIQKLENQHITRKDENSNGESNNKIIEVLENNLS